MKMLVNICRSHLPVVSIGSVLSVLLINAALNTGAPVRAKGAITIAHMLRQNLWAPGGDCTLWSSLSDVNGTLLVVVVHPLPTSSICICPALDSESLSRLFRIPRDPQRSIGDMDYKSKLSEVHMLDVSTGWTTTTPNRLLTANRDDHRVVSTPSGACKFWRNTCAVVMAPFALTGAPVFSAVLINNNDCPDPINTIGKWLRHIFTNISLLPITMISLGIALFLDGSANTAADGTADLSRLREIKHKFKTNADNIVAINSSFNVVNSMFIISLIVEMIIDSYDTIILFVAYWTRPPGSTLGPDLIRSRAAPIHLCDTFSHFNAIVESDSYRSFRLLKYYMSARLERTETPAVLCISAFLWFGFLSQSQRIMNTKSTSEQIRLDLDTGWPTKTCQLTPDRDDHWAQSSPGAQHFWRITFAIVMAPFALTGAPVFSAASHSPYPIDTTGKWLRHIFTNINLVPITILSLVGDIVNTLLFVGAVPKNVLVTIGDLINLLPIALPVTLFWFNGHVLPIHSISYSTYDWRHKHGITTESKLDFFGYMYFSIATTLLFVVYLTFASAIHCKCIELNEFILNSANTAPDGSVELGRLREIKRKFKTNADNIVAINKALNLVMSTFIITLIIEMFIDAVDIMLLFSVYWGRPVTSTLGPVTGGAHTSVRHVYPFRLLKYYMSARLERTETPAVLCISVFLGYNFLSQRFTARTNCLIVGAEAGNDCAVGLTTGGGPPP
ncbi:unnamed protein product [Medioppia subpectinata]|uniref:Uncharacterized protein n=1 Tax=Medioppia subpectinata TaxID=1979941 RepID=A0A7R9KQI1_9ACAR|nr:unnamed protein product [Medioppia subpectinata]CAG2106669.1 unnamed protein product [Medioppia subpectinata]